ncbi:MAG TPA: phenylalanine--tRNA ligase subunit beta, partial [Trueperaceae bacterium]|nr:phenylalanine--tRNA ligase subunit beta [Trueperaceae bacterium]
NTVNIALEMANFNPVVVRKMAKRHSIMTDAHYRFERGVDPNIILKASARASELISQIAGGRVHKGISLFGAEQALKTVDFRPSQVEFKMTLDIPLDLQRQYLERLGCNVAEQGADKWQITAPSWRYDMAIEEDIVEEVSRLYGFDKIAETLPAMYFVPAVKDSTNRALRSTLASFGLQEVISYIFTSDEELAKSKSPNSQVRLENPQGVERSVLRTALYPSLINIANNNKQEESLAIFEIGRVFNDIEQERLSILMRGPFIRANWLPETKLDFYYFKAILEKLARTYNASFELKAAKTDYLHPGISAKVFWADQELGYMGKLHPEIAASYGLKDIFIAELDLPLASGEIKFEDINRQPFAERDLAIILPEDVNYAEINAAISKSAGDNLKSIEVFDIYHGDNIEAGHYSMAVRLRFQATDNALTDAEVDQYMANVINSLEKMGYSIRGK